MQLLNRNSVILSIFTMVMSIPLFLSYQIKYVLFPAGFPFVFFFSWRLVSVPLVPILLLLEILVLGQMLLGPARIGSLARELVFTFAAIFTAVASIIVFLIVRSSP